MSTGLSRFWPRSLAVRLSILLIIALAAAQLGLTVLLNRERDSVVEELLHSQAFNQTVTLTRLLNVSQPHDTDALLAAFQSRLSCVSIGTASSNEPMSEAEEQLAFSLDGMLHGNQLGASSVNILENTDPHVACARSGDDAGPTDRDDGGDGDRDPDHDGDRSAALVAEVPLADGRWLRFVTAIDIASESSTRLSFVSFLFSSLAVAIVAVWVVRSQTTSLRSLADASDRFGRGEAVEHLPRHGPSEVVRATDAFNTMQSRLSQFMRDRIQLLASISHDLRTPLTTLRLKAEFIDDERVRDDLVATIDELTAIANAALEFTRAETASEATVSLDAANLVREIVAEYQLAKADVTLVQLESHRFSGRPVALKRALRNIVENAVRYGLRARLSVVGEGGKILIRVDDDGPGIPPDRLTEIFKPFVRLEQSRNTETGGLGLGLAIAQGIVQSHGGSVTLENLPQGGTRAQITLEQND